MGQCSCGSQSLESEASLEYEEPTNFSEEASELSKQTEKNATRIQACWRGYKIRKAFADKRKRICSQANVCIKTLWLFGEEIEIDDQYFQGTLTDGKKHGMGIYTFKSGRYVGEWLEDQITGDGTFEWNDGSRYEGTWFKGSMDGRGTYVWSSGRKYIGDIVLNKRQGNGVVFYSADKRFEGSWVNDLKEGYGRIVEKNKVWVGFWKQNRLIEWRAIK